MAQEEEQYKVGKRTIQGDDSHYLMVDDKTVGLYSQSDNVLVNQWQFNERNQGFDARLCLNRRGEMVRPWVDCRCGKLLIVEWDTAPPRKYTVWDLFTKEVITEVNIYYMFPPTVPVRAWITKEGVAITSGPKYDHGVSWSYIPYTIKYPWQQQSQTFLGCWVTRMVVDDLGELVAVYDYEDDNIYVYEMTTTPIKGHTRGRSAAVPTHIKRVFGDHSVELTFASRHDDTEKPSLSIMELKD